VRWSSLGIYERFEINPLSTWLNEHGKVEGKGQKIKNSIEVGNEKRAWLSKQML
jgi:hypothetical protein